MVPLKPLELRQEAPLTAKQQEHIAALASRYTTRTAGSKQHVERTVMLADPRVASGFHPEWKELVYPLVVQRAQGAHLWDKDGNRYIDILNGYGSILFGHSPQFVTEASASSLSSAFPSGRRRSWPANAPPGRQHDRHGARLLLQHRLGGGHGGDASCAHGYRP